MSFLVTGVAGFIGSSIAHRLLHDGEKVVGVDSVNDYYSPKIKSRRLDGLLGHRNFRFHRVDLLSADLEDIFRGVRIILHQAGQPGVRSSWNEGFEDHMQRNVALTQRLLESIRGKSKIEKFVYASSSSIYGNVGEGSEVSESAVPAPFSPYGVTKLAAEHMTRLYASNFDVPTVSLRYFTVYGPEQRPDMAFCRFIDAAVRGGELRLYGDGTQTRDFTYVDDVVEANLRAAEANRSAHGSVFNICGGSTVSVNQVINAIADLSDLPLRVVREARKSGDVAHTSGSNLKAERDLGWKPQVDLREGIARQFDWQKRNAN